MTSDEVWDLLELIASIDRRKVGLTDRQVWQGLIGDLSAADAQAAVVAHYSETADWIMPAHIRQRVKAIRDQRLQDTEIPAEPLIALMDDPPAYLAAVRAANAAIADGRDPETAMRAITRQQRPELEAR